MLKSKNKQTGSVLIMVLWLIMLGLILVTAIASNIRLSATTVINHQQALSDWSHLLETINKAHMELLISKMKKVGVQQSVKFKGKEKTNLFMGQALELSYETPEGLTVRISDLSGKINISGLKEQTLKQLLEQHLGEYNKKIPELVDAWFDWIDTDDLKRLNGAEKQYYKKQKLDYIPRNASFESVDEILLIKGFKSVFSEVNLETVFTLYGGKLTSKINPNSASKQVLVMIPGISEKIAEDIIKARELQEFKLLNELDIHLPPSVMAKAKQWFTIKASDYYSIAIYPSDFETKDSRQKTVSAYVEDVLLQKNQELPVVLRVVPGTDISIN